MRTVLITGGAGFFGELLKRQVLAAGHQCVSIDLQPDFVTHPQLVSIQGDIRSRETMEQLLERRRIDTIYHCATVLAHVAKDKEFLWTSNVDGTRNIAELARQHQVKRVVFISSNCLWAENFHRPVTEEDIPRPAEIYGRSKWEGEKILLGYTDYFKVIIFRSPTIVDCGRLGLLSILFEFIDEGRKVWVVGGGHNVYQFIYAEDLVDACLKAMDYDQSAIFNIGSDDVKSFKAVYDYVIARARTGARTAALPKGPTLALMKLFYHLNLSPLGPYQYKMIAEDFMFDTSKIKKELGWKPTMTNEAMLYKAYEYYHENQADIRQRANVSAHKQPVKLGIIRLLKWLS